MNNNSNNDDYVSQEIINGKVYNVHHYDNGCTSILGDPQKDFVKALSEEIVKKQEEKNNNSSSNSTYNDDDNYYEDEFFKYELLKERMEKQNQTITDYKSWYNQLSDEEKKLEDGRILKAKEEHDKKSKNDMLQVDIAFVLGVSILVLPLVIFLIFCFSTYNG